MFLTTDVWTETQNIVNLFSCALFERKKDLKSAVAGVLPLDRSHKWPYLNESMTHLRKAIRIRISSPMMVIL